MRLAAAFHVLVGALVHAGTPQSATSVATRIGYCGSRPSPPGTGAAMEPWVLKQSAQSAPISRPSRLLAGELDRRLEERDEPPVDRTSLSEPCSS